MVRMRALCKKPSGVAKKPSLLVAIGLLLILALPVESLPLPVRAQIIPLTSLLALPFLPFVLKRIKVTPLMQAVIIFVLFTLLHSMVALFIDIGFLRAGTIRIYAWARQLAALLAGLAVFFVLRTALLYISDRALGSAVLVGAVPALALSLANVVWGVTGDKAAGILVTSVRSFLLPRGFNHPSRVSGLSLEPAHFAFYLAVIVFPIVLTRLRERKKSMALLCFSGLLTTAFVWTFSTTGFIVLLSMLFGGIIFGVQRKLFLKLIVGIVVAITVMVSAFPSNYMIMQLRYLLSGLSGGEFSLSITNRLYSSLGPFLTTFSSYTLLGYGLGGTASHFPEIIPPQAQEDIARVSWRGMPNLRTLTGRLLAEAGLIGLTLMSFVLFIAFRQLDLALKTPCDVPRRNLLQSGRFALVGLIVGYTIIHGSFALPYLWFWLAVIDSRYLLRAK